MIRWGYRTSADFWHWIIISWLCSRLWSKKQMKDLTSSLDYGLSYISLRDSLTASLFYEKPESTSVHGWFFTIIPTAVFTSLHSHRITAIICLKILLEACLHCMHCKHSWQMLSVSLCEHNYGTNGSSYYKHKKQQQQKKNISVGTRNDSFYDNQKCLWIKWLYIYHEASHNFILTWKVYMCKLVYCQEWNWFTMLKVGLNTEPVIREL